MIERFRQLAPREQFVLGAGALLAVVIIGWGFIWSPLSNGAADLGESVADKGRLLIDLRRASNLGSASAAAPRRNAAQSSSLIVLVDETARPIGLSTRFTRTSPDGSDAIMVSFRDAPFDLLIAWLVDLEQTEGVLVETFSSSPTGQPGIVSGQVRLRRS